MPGPPEEDSMTQTKEDTMGADTITLNPALVQKIQRYIVRKLITANINEENAFLTVLIKSLVI